MQLQAFVRSFRSFVEITPGVSEDDRRSMKSRWESQMSSGTRKDFPNRKIREINAQRYKSGVVWRLVKVSMYSSASHRRLTLAMRWQDFQTVANDCVCDLQDSFEYYLADKCDEGTVKVGYEESDDIGPATHKDTRPHSRRSRSQTTSHPPCIGRHTERVRVYFFPCPRRIISSNHPLRQLFAVMDHGQGT